MSATAKYIGGGGVGTFMPTTVAGLAAAEAALVLPVADLEAQIAGAAGATASVAIQPPSLDLVAAIAGSLQVPGVAVDITAMASLGGVLEISVGALKVALGLAVQLLVAFGGGGVHAYKLEGDVSGMAGALGVQLQSGLPGEGPNDVGIGIVLVAGANKTAVAALKSLFAL